MSGLGFSDGPSKLDQSREHAAGISDYFRKGNTLPSIADAASFAELAIRELALNSPPASAAAHGAIAGRGPTRATTIPSDPAKRKTFPVASGVLDYFPDAIAAVAHLSYVGNEQHNPGQPLHWARGKSTDESDTLLRHFLQRGTLDSDGIRHSAKVAWRALALLQKEIEADQGGLTGQQRIAMSAKGQMR